VKKVISYSLWGNDDRYLVGAIRNVEQAKEMFEDWVCRFYIDKDVKTSFVEELSKFESVEIVQVTANRNFDGMFWRFFAASDNDVDVMLSRDTDSRFSLREVHAVKEWLESDKKFHIIRDHPYHNVSIMGGMWGCKKGVIDIGTLLKGWTSYERKGCDQDFLGQLVWPIVKDESMIHDEVTNLLSNNTFKIPRDGYNFIGDAIGADDKRLDDDGYNALKRIVGNNEN
tara:strand:- start:388 stop:1068 length:681 start_codon:yes stop_codon:yes gene_type:complete